MVQYCTSCKMQKGFFFFFFGLVKICICWHFLTYIFYFCILDIALGKCSGLCLNGNKLTNLNKIWTSKVYKFAKFTKIKAVKNKIQYLSEKDFIQFNLTEHMELQVNQIRWIDTDTFKPMRMRLRYLDLSSNLITSLNGSVRYMSHLRTLRLQENLIQVTIHIYFVCVCVYFSFKTS